MSNDARGRLYPVKADEIEQLAFFIKEKYQIGIMVIDSSQLYNFPTDSIPQHLSESFLFAIGDEFGNGTASYLLDYIDYAPEDKLRSPHVADLRLAILLDCLQQLMNISRQKYYKLL